MTDSKTNHFTKALSLLPSGGGQLERSRSNLDEATAILSRFSKRSGGGLDTDALRATWREVVALVSQTSGLINTMDPRGTVRPLVEALRGLSLSVDEIARELERVGR